MHIHQASWHLLRQKRIRRRGRTRVRRYSEAHFGILSRNGEEFDIKLKASMVKLREQEEEFARRRREWSGG